MFATACVCAITTLVVSQLEPLEDFPYALPIVEASEHRFHISKGGEWSLELEVTFRFEDVKPSQEARLARQFCESFLKVLPEEILGMERQVVKKIQNHRWKGTVKSRKTNDMALLAHVMREQMQMRDSTFSWNKRVFEVSEVAPSVQRGGKEQSAKQSRRNDGGDNPDGSGVIIGLFAGVATLALLSSDTGANLRQSLNASELIVITTDGNLSSIAPAKVDIDGKSLTIDGKQIGNGKNDPWWIRIEDLEAP